MRRKWKTPGDAQRFYRIMRDERHDNQMPAGLLLELGACATQPLDFRDTVDALLRSVMQRLEQRHGSPSESQVSNELLVFFAHFVLGYPIATVAKEIDGYGPSQRATATRIARDMRALLRRNAVRCGVVSQEEAERLDARERWFASPWLA